MDPRKQFEIIWTTLTTFLVGGYRQMIKFMIGEPICKKTNPKNKFALHVNVMHGDADNYEDLDAWFFSASGDSKNLRSSIEDLRDAVNILNKMTKTNSNRRNIKIVEEYYKSKNLPDEKDVSYYYYGWCDFLPGDIKYQLASVQSFKVTYWDNCGIEHNVQIVEGSDDV